MTERTIYGFCFLITTPLLLFGLISEGLIGPGLINDLFTYPVTPIVGAVGFLFSLWGAYYVWQGGKIRFDDKGSAYWGLTAAESAQKANQKFRAKDELTAEEWEEVYALRKSDREKVELENEARFRFTCWGFLVPGIIASLGFQSPWIGGLLYLSLFGSIFYGLVDWLGTQAEKIKLYKVAGAGAVVVLGISLLSLGVVVLCHFFLPVTLTSVYRAPVYIIAWIPAAVLMASGYFYMREIARGEIKKDKTDDKIRAQARMSSLLMLSGLTAGAIASFYVGNRDGVSYLFWTGLLTAVAAIGTYVGAAIHQFEKLKGLWSDAAAILGVGVVLTPCAALLAGTLFPWALGTAWINSNFVGTISPFLPWVFGLLCLAVTCDALVGRTLLFRNKRDLITALKSRQKKAEGTEKPSSSITPGQLNFLALFLGGLMILINVGLLFVGYSGVEPIIGYVGLFFLVFIPIESYSQRLGHKDSVWHWGFGTVYSLLLAVGFYNYGEFAPQLKQLLASAL